MNNTNAKLKLTFDSLDNAKRPREFESIKRRFLYSLADDNRRFWSVEHSVVHAGNLFEKP